jgi:hypothetical protein
MLGKRLQATSIGGTGMKGAVFTAAIISLSFIAAYGQTGSNSILRGTIRTSDGKPISGAKVSQNIMRIVETDEKGTFAVPIFRLKTTGTVIAIRANGYKPASKIVEPTTETLDVVLQENPGGNRTIPECTTKENSEKRQSFWWGGLWFRIPGKLKHKKVTDVDYIENNYMYEVKGSKEWLSIMEGHMASGGRPLDKTYLSSTEFEESLVTVGEAEFLDAIGRTTDGKRWRWFGGISFVSYENVSDEAANYFDQMIDSVCRKERIVK